MSDKSFPANLRRSDCGEQYPEDVTQRKLYHMFERTSEVLTGSTHWDNKIVKNAGGTDRPRVGVPGVRFTLWSPRASKMDATASWWQVEQAVSQSTADWGIKIWILSLYLWLGSPSVWDVRVSKSLPGQTPIYQQDRSANQGHFILIYCFPGEYKHLINPICSGWLYVFISNNHFWTSRV